MTDSNGDHLDIVKELRLRQWARLHYVPSAERLASWHPVVLDEMTRRDAEGDPTAAVQTIPSFVPLPPARYHEVHAGHEGLAEPKLVKGRPNQQTVTATFSDR